MLLKPIRFLAKQLARSAICWFPLIVMFLVSGVPSHAYAGDEVIQLLLPDLNVSSRPVVEFRARKATISPASPGHAYVLLGRELDNGLRVFNTVAGFYPDERSAAAPFMQLFSTKGIVTQKLDDAKSEITLSLYITPIQEQKVVTILKSYDAKNYSLAIRNCVTMTKDVASAVGLTMPNGVGDAVPQVFLQSLIDANKDKAPVPGPPPETVQPAAAPMPELPTYNAIDAARFTIDLTAPPPIVLPILTDLPQIQTPQPPVIMQPQLPPTQPTFPPVDVQPLN